MSRNDSRAFKVVIIIALWLLLVALLMVLFSGCASRPKPFPIEKIQGVEPSILPIWVENK